MILDEFVFVLDDFWYFLEIHIFQKQVFQVPADLLWAVEVSSAKVGGFGCLFRNHLHKVSHPGIETTLQGSKWIVIPISSL